MEQFLDSVYKWSHEGEFFVISDIDKNFFACRYLGSNLGFVIDKQVFSNHISKGKIRSYRDNHLAV